MVRSGPGAQRANSAATVWGAAPERGSGPAKSTRSAGWIVQRSRARPAYVSIEVFEDQQIHLHALNEIERLKRVARCEDDCAAGNRGGPPAGTSRAMLQTAAADGSIGTTMCRRRASRAACSFSRLSRRDATFCTTRLITALEAAPPGAGGNHDPSRLARAPRRPCRIPDSELHELPRGGDEIRGAPLARGS